MVNASYLTYSSRGWHLQQASKSTFRLLWTAPLAFCIRIVLTQSAFIIIITSASARCIPARGQMKLCATPVPPFKGNICVAHWMPLSTRLHDADHILYVISKFLVHLHGEGERRGDVGARGREAREGEDIDKEKMGMHDLRPPDGQN